MRSFRIALMLASMLLASACASTPATESAYFGRDGGAANNYFMDGRIMKF